MTECIYDYDPVFMTMIAIQLSYIKKVYFSELYCSSKFVHANESPCMYKYYDIKLLNKLEKNLFIVPRNKKI